MPLDYTKPAPNPTSNSPNVGLPCPPPIATETLEQFNSPPNCSGYHPNVRSALSHSSSPFTCERHALEKGENSHRSGMCQSFVFNLLKHFGLQRLLFYSCNFAGLGKKGKIQREECVRVLAFQCQNFPFQEYLFPTAYHLRKVPVENLCISEASLHFRRPAPGVEHAQTGHIQSKSRVRVDLNFS